jgi:signal transduction histidine kinase
VSGGSIVSRVSRGTVLAALVTAVTLAAASAAITFGLWRARERQALADTVRALAAAVQRESRDEHSSFEAAAPEAIRESSVTGYRIEAWQGDRLLAANLPGPPLGPSGAGPFPPGWLVRAESLDGGVVVLVAARTHGGEALRVFGGALVLATPICLGVAFLIGGVVGRRATRPLVEFKARIVGARPFAPLPEEAIPGAPSEVRELDEAFRSLWLRLREGLAREVDFAANASHELRTPLTRIRLHAERARVDAGPLAREELRALASEVDRMVRLVESLLVLAKDASSGVPGAEAVNLADGVRTAATRLLPAGSEGVAALPDEAIVRGDEELLGIAVFNLLDNAVKFGAPGRPPSLLLREAGGRVRLRVASPGTSIGDGERDHLFDRFYRGPQARVAPRGHGVGLPLARHIARLHGGDVSCLSGPGEDACFELELPAWAEATGPDRPGAPRSSDGQEREA